MAFRVSITSAATIRDLKAAGRSVAGALMKGINATALEVQTAQRAHQRSVFTVRRQAFMDRSVKISKFAKRGDLRAEVRIEPPGGQRTADIITQHEAGGDKTPRGRSLTVPVDARRGKRDLVPARLRPKALGLEPHGTSGRVAVGGQRTILIRDGRGGGVLLQRKGKRGRLSVLYTLAARARVTPRLKFRQNAERIVRRDLGRNVAKAINESLRNPRA